MPPTGGIALAQGAEPSVLLHMAASAPPDDIRWRVVEGVSVLVVPIDGACPASTHWLDVSVQPSCSLVSSGHGMHGYSLAGTRTSQITGAALDSRTASERRAAGAEMVCWPPVGSFGGHGAGSHGTGAAPISLPGDRFPTSTPTCRVLGGSFGQPLPTQLVVAGTASFGCQASGTQRITTVDAVPDCSSHEGMVPL
jgi:hypothetical protein